MRIVLCLSAVVCLVLLSGCGSRDIRPVAAGMDEGTSGCPEVSGTFSIVAVDPNTGVCGAAVASRYPAVGKVVPYVRAGVGAFCTQHWHHPAWGEHGARSSGPGPPAGRGAGRASAGRSAERQTPVGDYRHVRPGGESQLCRRRPSGSGGGPRPAGTTPARATRSPAAKSSMPWPAPTNKLKAVSPTG
jgi:hypothetical protein